MTPSQSTDELVREIGIFTYPGGMSSPEKDAIRSQDPDDLLNRCKDTIERLQRELLDQERELMHKEGVVKRQMRELSECNARLDQLSLSEAAIAQTNAQLRSQLAARDKTIEALREDAGRYRWLVENAYLNDFWDGYVDASIDTAIDSAMADAARSEEEKQA